MVMPNKVVEAKAAAGAGTEEGRRPTVVPAPAAANPELSDRPTRRTFTVGDKRRILEETDRAAGTGGIGAILRREGLYSTHLVRNPGMVPNETICGVRRFHRVVFQRCVRCPPILHESFKKLE